jgi:hypothetical protein
LVQLSAKTLGGGVYPIVKPEDIEIAVNRGTSDELPFYCVSAAKFTTLSLVTFGLYELFWFYKNWVLIKARTGGSIRPFWRACFSPIFCYPFAVAVKSAAESVNLTQRTNPGAIAAIYVGLIILQRLPDPYSLICLFSFVPLIPIVWRIREIHEAIRPGFESAIGWNGWSFSALAVGAVVSGLAIAVTFGPSTRALRQSEIPSSYNASLVEAGVLEPNEQIEFFYSAGLFSILEDGNLLTEKRAVSYATVEGELYVASSAYPEIRELEVEYSENSFTDTVITVLTMGGDDFILFVSSEGGRDREFVSDLEGRIPDRQ